MKKYIIITSLITFAIIASATVLWFNQGDNFAVKRSETEKQVNKDSKADIKSVPDVSFTLEQQLYRSMLDSVPIPLYEEYSQGHER